MSPQTCVRFVLFFCSLTTACVANDEIQTLTFDRFKYQVPYGSLAISPDNELIVVNVGREIQVIETKSKRISQQIPENPFVMRFTRDGSRMFFISTSKRALYSGDLTRGYAPQLDVAPGYVGMSLGENNRHIVISKVNPGGPVAGLNEVDSGDELVAIGEGRSGSVSTVSSVRSAIRMLGGPAGTYVRIQVIHAGESETETYTVRRMPAVQKTTGLQFLDIEVPKLNHRLAHCTRDGRHNFDDVATGQTMSQFETIDVNNVGVHAISPDSQKFAILSRMKNGQGNAIEVFDIATTERLAFIPHLATTFYDLKFSADSKQIYAATHETIEFSDLKEKRTVGRMFLDRNPTGDSGHVKIALKLDVSSKDLFATGSSTGLVRLWNAKSGILVKTLGTAGKEPVQDVLFSDDGSLVVWFVGKDLNWLDVSKLDISVPETPDGFADSEVRGFDREAKAEEPVKRPTHDRHLLTIMTHRASEQYHNRIENFLEFSPDGKAFYLGGALGLIPTSPAPVEEEKKTSSGSVTNIVTSVADAVATGGKLPPGIIPIYEPGMSEYPIGGISRSLFGEHGKMPGTVDQYRVADGKWLRTFECLNDKKLLAPCKAADLSPDGKLLAILEGSRGQLNLFDTESGKRMFGLEERIDGKNYNLNEVAFLGDSKRLLTFNSNDNQLLMQSSANGRILDAIALGNSYHSGLHVSDDGDRIYQGLNVFDARTAKRLIEPERTSWNTLDVSHDGQKVLADHSYRLYLVEGTKQAQFSPAFERPCMAACFSPDDRFVALARDRHIEIWSVGSRQLIETIDAHLRTVELLAFSPDGKILASNSRDGSTRLWDVSDLATRGELKLSEFADDDAFEQKDGVKYNSAEGTLNGVIVGKVGSDKWLVEFEESWSKVLPGKDLERILPTKRAYAPEQALGAPDTKLAGDNFAAWVPSSQDKTEWLLLEYKPKVAPKSVVVHENCGPGAITEVALFDDNGNQTVCYEAMAAELKEESRILTVRVNKSVSIRYVRIKLDCSSVSGWNEIDAVGLIDAKGTHHWARRVKASSSYASGKIPPVFEANPPKSLE